MKKTISSIKLFILFIIVNISLVYLQSCDDEPTPLIVCDSTNTAFLPQELLDRFYFNEGTWWVYRDSLNGNRDSVWLVRSIINIGKEPELRRNCGQGASYNYKTSSGDAWLVTINSESTAGIDKFSNLRYDINYSNTNKNNDIFRFDYQNSTYQNPTDEGGVVLFKDSISLKGKVYKNILYLEYKQKPIPSEIIKLAWYSKHYGLVKYMTWDGRVWELANSHINQ